MAFLQGDNRYRPRSKKEKEKLQKQRKQELLAKRERQRQQRNTPSFQPKYEYPQRNTGINIKGSVIKPLSSSDTEQKVTYTDEMLERERAAQAEAERRKKCVAPSFNKGPYQYIYTEEQARDVGK